MRMNQSNGRGQYGNGGQDWDDRQGNRRNWSQLQGQPEHVIDEREYRGGVTQGSSQYSGYGQYGQTQHGGSQHFGPQNAGFDQGHYAPNQEYDSGQYSGSFGQNQYGVRGTPRGQYGATDYGQQYGQQQGQRSPYNTGGYGPGSESDWRGQSGSGQHQSGQGPYGQGQYGQGQYGQGRGQLGMQYYGQGSSGQGSRQGQSGYGSEYGTGQGWGGGSSYSGSGNYGAGSYGASGNWGPSGYGSGGYGSSWQGSHTGGATYGAGSGGVGTGGGQGGSMAPYSAQYGERQRGAAPKGYKKSDQRINEDVCERLMDEGIDCSNVDLQVKDGNVTLSGEVKCRKDKHRIEEIAADMSGVQDVENNLRLSKSGSADSYAEGKDNSGKYNETSSYGSSPSAGTTTGISAAAAKGSESAAGKKY